MKRIPDSHRLVGKARLLLRTLGVLSVAAVALAVFAGGALAAKPYDLVYFDGHMHTVESDGSGTLADLKTAALERGLDAVIVTNHTAQITLDEWKSMNRRSRELSNRNFLMINAFEVTGSEGLFLRDHVLAWDVADPFVGRDSKELAPEEVWTSPQNPAGTGPLYPESIAKWTSYIHKQGGVAVHAHTTGSTQLSYGVDFIELFNMNHVKDVAENAMLLGFSAADAWNLGLVLNNAAIYGDRDLGMMVQLPGMPEMPLAQALYFASQGIGDIGQVLGVPGTPIHSWDELLMAYVNGDVNRPIFGVANSDSHNTANLDKAGDFSDVGEAKNGVFILGRLNQESLMRGIKAGRLFATTGPSLEFTVNGRMMGETVKSWLRKALPTRLSITVDAESPTALIAQVTIIKNGEVWQTLSPMSPTFATSIWDSADKDGYYRIEVVTVDSAGQYQFAYSNPVFIDAQR